MSGVLVLVILVITLALVFDFLNGFNDSANAIATVVVTKTLTPLQAVLMAGTANFIGYFIFGVEIAKTIGKGIVQIDFITLPILLSSILGAITWNIIVWRLGLPSSSSHALIGGMVGSAIAAVGFKAIIISGVMKIVLFIFLAPLFGMTGAIIFTKLVMIICRNAHYQKTKRVFRILQLLSSTIYSISHGTNDAQKTMGIIALALFVGGMRNDFVLQEWIIIACYSAIGLGTLCGGWRIVRTVGTKITKIHSMEGFCAETSAAIVLLGTAHFGIPVSTTHIISTSIMGVGTAERTSKVRWITARNIVWAWILTIPLTALWASLLYFVISKFA
ncbi:MAG: inorganic phosphate transporter [Chitinivibrionales bacterium]|nr:inorganic phosphate transporter [Chitinivibrionales bacterium]